MKTNKYWSIIIYCCTYLILTLSTLTATAAERCENAVARTISAQGSLEVRYAGQSNWQAAKLNDRFCTGDALRTGQDSRVAIMLLPETVIRLDQFSSMVFTRPDTETSPSLLELLKGAAHFISRDPRALQIITPFANAAIEGTEFLVQVGAQQTGVTVYEGKVLVGNNSGGIAVTSGKRAIAQTGQAPVVQAVVQPRDAVQWTLYYPPVLLQGDATMQQAAAALAVGQVDSASALLDQALATHAGNSDALALKSIIAVTQNDKALALTLANQAVSANPNSAAAYIALSYAQQAHFDLSGALNSLQQAISHEPGNALAWARLAEMWLSVGDLDKGLVAAEQAHGIDPNLSLTQTVLGFAYLTRIRIPESLDAFKRAITLDQAAPLPRLGLGLAKIRKGELIAGREQIEIAVILDPGNSLVRSYMGKAYFEEKRDKLAASQYEIAKELDPSDPTPWFYNAIRKQTENRPVEALHDLQESIKLNDNRAVFRSRLELDADLATRSASIARIYNDLGFQQRALVEGWQSVNTDPGNFSAHRLLADSYSSLPRHEVARVSELLQSQLLQPINLNPVQPQLAETNLSLLVNAGPSDPAFLEFNPLFTRNRLALQVNGVVGGNSTWGDDLVHNGVYNNWSWSIGQFHYESDGYRENNDQDQNAYNLFVQGALTHRTSVQAELRHREIERGDLVQRFDPDDFIDTQRDNEKSETARLGLHHMFTPGSEIIVSYINEHDYEFDTEQTVSQPLPPIPGLPPLNSDSALDISAKEQGHTAEIQHLYHGASYKLVSGAGIFDSDINTDLTADTTIEPPVLPGTSLVSESDQEIKQKNAYVYAYIPWGDTLTFTLGASYDDFESDETEVDTLTFNGISLPPEKSTTKYKIDKNQFNPKFGITWQVQPDTTLRAAGFRTVARSLSSSQTVEPTQVAGFNQFYDDPEGSDINRYGLAIDQVFTTDLTAGAEYSWRDLEVVISDDDSTFDWDEQFARAYLYWTPHPRLAASAEYQYEKFDRDPAFTGKFRATELRTHKLPLGINYFHPNGLIGKLSATFIDQKGDFSTSGPGFIGDAPTKEESDNFWLVDASIGYRLPKRRGLISLGVSNLFDESFNFVDTDPFNPRVYPERLVFGRFTLAF
jgi:tetratricopeptide (TPR) repeat protein